VSRTGGSARTICTETWMGTRGLSRNTLHNRTIRSLPVKPHIRFRRIQQFGVRCCVRSPSSAPTPPLAFSAVPQRGSGARCSPRPAPTILLTGLTDSSSESTLIYRQAEGCSRNRQSQSAIRRDRLSAYSVIPNYRPWLKSDWSSVGVDLTTDAAGARGSTLAAIAEAKALINRGCWPKLTGAQAIHHSHTFPDFGPFRSTLVFSRITLTFPSRGDHLGSGSRPT
jgi:hypothetical protein